MESDDTSFRYCDAAIKLRKETLQQKKGRGKVSSEWWPPVERELELLTMLDMKDKSDVSHSLKNLDEDHLFFSKDGTSSILKGGV